MTMSEVVDYLAGKCGWSSSVPNLSGKLKRGSLRYGEAATEGSCPSWYTQKEPRFIFWKMKPHRGRIST